MITIRQNRLGAFATFSLFATSYSPLFLLMVIRQISKHREYASWGGLTTESLRIFMKYFGLSIILIAVIMFGFIGVYIFIVRIGNSARTNGIRAQLTDVKNKNSESISYIGTYIIPFLFQDYASMADLLSVTILLIVIYFIYINSSLLLINPALNLRYSLYEVEFLDNFEAPNAKTKSGMIITRQKYLEDGDDVLFKSIGHKLYFAIRDERG